MVSADLVDEKWCCEFFTAAKKHRMLATKIYIKPATYKSITLA